MFSFFWDPHAANKSFFPAARRPLHRPAALCKEAPLRLQAHNAFLLLGPACCQQIISHAARRPLHQPGALCKEAAHLRFQAHSVALVWGPQCCQRMFSMSQSGASGRADTDGQTPFICIAQVKEPSLGNFVGIPVLNIWLGLHPFGDHRRQSGPATMHYKIL